MAARSNNIWPRRAGILFLASWKKHLRNGVTTLKFRRRIHLEPLYKLYTTLAHPVESAC